MMVPAHIEQDCNAYDAARNGAGIVSEDFAMGDLLEFSKIYKPNRDFIRWVRSSERLLMYAIEHNAASSANMIRTIPTI